MTDQLIRTVLWQGLWRPGVEWCELSKREEGWRLAGTALLAVADQPVQVHYRVELDRDWSTLGVAVRVRSGDGAAERRLRLSVLAGQHWQLQRELDDLVDADAVEALRGLIDIDLGFTPSTNTLPIRRLAPDIGPAVDVTAAWVRFPELTVEPLPQRYTRLSERRYRYESGGGAFVAELEVDDLGLVIAYEGAWTRLAEANGRD